MLHQPKRHYKGLLRIVVRRWPDRDGVPYRAHLWRPAPHKRRNRRRIAVRMRNRNKF